MNRIKKILSINIKNRLLFILFLSVFLCSCSDDVNHKSKKSLQAKTITATEKPSSLILYYSGVIKPLNLIPVVSPFKGTIIKKNFQYGLPVKKGQLLLVIESSELASKFSSSLTEYLKAKNTLDTDQSEYIGKKELWRLQFISENDYNSARSKYEISRVDLVQKRKTLSKLIKELGIAKEVEQITLSDIAKISKYLSTRGDMKIYSPADGFALFPTKGSDTSKAVNVSSAVKANSVILEIAKLDRLSVAINISEIHFYQLQYDQKVTITGPAFPGITLHGRIVSQEGQVKSDQGLPSFPVKIIINNVPHNAESNKFIYPGMSTKVKLEMKLTPKIRVPLSSVSGYGTNASVKIYDPKTKKIKTVPVKTGQTSQNEVEILSGLHVGEQVIVDSKD